MSNVMSKIIEWGTTLPLWEQLALSKILGGEKFTDDTFNELADLLLEEAELTDSKKERTQTMLEIYANRADSQTTGKALLHQVSNLKNINALVSDQKLEFGEKATVIFGENGSGKSGYARLIASAAFTRGDKEILRNVKKTFNETDTLSADIYLKFGDTPPEPIHHIVGQPCPDMHTFYVFDSTSVKTHLTKANSMSFAPSNLDIFTKLAEVTDEVRKKLSQKIEQVRKPPINIALFEGESDVSKEIETLSSKTDESKIIALGRLSEEETQRISDLDKQIAELKSTDFPKLIANIDQKVKDLKTLIISLESTGKKLDHSVQKNIHETIESWGDQNTLSSQLSIDAFKTETLSTIGSPAWYEFAKAGLSLAITESTKAPYPSTNSVCLLCHQPLSSDAHDHLHRLWELLRNDTQKKIEHLEERLEKHRQSLLLIDFDFFNDQSVSYRLLSTEYQSEMNLIEEFLSFCKKHRSRLLAAIFDKHTFDITELSENGVSDLWRVIGQLETQKKILEEKKSGAEEEIRKLETDFKLLEHRKLLSAIMDETLAYIHAEKWIQKASSSKVKRTTAHITKKYNELFSDLVTDKYLNLFIETLKNLRCPLDVEIKYKAEKGQTYKQLALKTSADYLGNADPDKVLSEGEQRAVALADFFTEIALDEQSSGFILDDPVTSLDFRWKETIADNIIKESANKQAIIFTHDLHFLHCLKTKADEQSIDIRAHWIQKRDGLPGFVFNDNSPMSEKDYKTSKNAKEFHKKALAPGVSAEEQQYLLDLGFSALRTSYEAFIMFELFNGVVLRFEERISGDRLKKIYIDDNVRDDVAESVGRISRYIGAHLHSDINAAQKPTPQMLNDEIAHFEDLRKTHKSNKKEHGIIE